MSGIDKISKFLYEDEFIYFEHIKNDHISKSFSSGFYELTLLNKIRRMGIKGTYVDLGAHIGNHSIFMSKFCNCSNILSIEGNKFNYDYLYKNIELNKCKNIKAYNWIISDEADYYKFNFSMKNTGASSALKTFSQDGELSYRLDDVLKNQQDISLIKLDIENLEYQALISGERIIEKFHPIIIIELHKYNKYYNEILKFLNKHNYTTDGISYAGSPTFIYF